MPERYHIHTVPTPARFRRVGKFGTADWREDCSRCKNCVKVRCVYDLYRSEAAYNRDAAAPVEPIFECKSCLSCVQGCTKGLLSLTLNPAFLALGDTYWRPDIIATTWDQAESGRIPVSGAGYRGPFSGPGFDSMWTDMSEIVRPTRDGIHGREYISTSVDIGSKPMRLDFDATGALKNGASLLEVPMPGILDAAPWGDPSEAIVQARVRAAAALRTLAVVPARYLPAVAVEQRRCVVPLFGLPGTRSTANMSPAEANLAQVRMAEILDGPNTFSTANELWGHDRRLLVSVRLPLRPDAAQRAQELYEGGISIIHLCADHQGRELGAERPRFIKDVLREIHGALVKHGVRDEVTLIAGGGIALAEHMAKAVICGADLVGVDIPLLVALGCRVCAGGHASGCPARIQEEEVAYAAQRMVNLMGAWHSQLIEVLGAMGIREVRRLRGEVGRAMFLEDLERDAFKELVRTA
ncbi:MAG: glutamate synthase-related protein [Planctomycetota bacterium]|nr:glutamate synthase-related protein [Planctomycetota bacterium]